MKMSSTSRLTNRSVSVMPCNQGDKSDCGIYVITNVFMREIVLLLGWSNLTMIDLLLIETNNNNCSDYDFLEDKTKLNIVFL